MKGQKYNVTDIKPKGGSLPHIRVMVKLPPRSASRKLFVIAIDFRFFFCNLLGGI
jgi:hypothetical protein